MPAEWHIVRIPLALPLSLMNQRDTTTDAPICTGLEKITLSRPVGEVECDRNGGPRQRNDREAKNQYADGQHDPRAVPVDQPSDGWGCEGGDQPAEARRAQR